ncbi:MAG: hypothetical protein ABSG82_07200 [Sedimentisphaerales bacterium]|jgi:hypothetical protein
MSNDKIEPQREAPVVAAGVQVPNKGVSNTDGHPSVASPAGDVPAPGSHRSFTKPEPIEQTTPAPKQTVYEQLVSAVHVKHGLPLNRSWLAPLLKIWGQISGKLLAPKPGVSSVRQKVTILMMPVLAVVFIFMLTRVFRSPASPSVKLPTGIASSATTSAGGIDWELPPLYPETLRDPMRFSSTAHGRENAGGPIVKGIVYSEDNPRAIVGDRIVSTGDVVDGATVVKINPDSVEFTVGDKTWTQKIAR